MCNECTLRVNDKKMENNSSDIDDNSSEESEEEVSISGTGNGKVSSAITARPNTSAGYWLCTLLPLALVTNYLHDTKCFEENSSSMDMMTIAATGMCIETLCFFLYMFFKSGLLLKLLIAFVPGLVTTLLYTTLLQRSWSFALFWGFAVTFCYQNAYIRVMRGLPRSFSYGEAALLVQGVMLFALNVILRLPSILLERKVESDFAQLNVIMMFALFCLLVACCVLAIFKHLRTPHFFYPLMLLLMLAVTCTPVTEPIPIVALIHFLIKDSTRITIISIYLALVTFTVLTVWWQIGSAAKASTRIRKIFHLLIVFVYVPGLFYQCAFLYIASGVALAIFTVLELFRVLNIPPLAPSLRRAFASFSDEKDAGILALTPFCLLVGCSLPIWINPCPCGWNKANTYSGVKILSLMAGILTVGFGDTAASVFGSKIGRIKWRDSTRTLEGTAAFIFSILTAILCFNLCGYIPMSSYEWFIAICATVITALIEAFTDQIDNIVLPLVFFTIVNISCFA